MHDYYNKWINSVKTANEFIVSYDINKPTMYNWNDVYKLSINDEENSIENEHSGWLKACVLGEFESEGCIESVDPDEFEKILNGG